jgi:RNA 3'-terminal phosphate cyclase (ATP)
MTDLMRIDGSDGEGGGQVLRTSLSLSALTGRPFRLENIRAGRSQPGLRPQHLLAVRATAALCAADLVGDALNSTTLEFWPRQPARAGHYEFDVNDHTPHQSAGAVTLVWQTLIWPLLFADAPSTLVLRGGTHVPFSPSADYVKQVAVPAYAQLGAHLELTVNEWGWMARGGGEITAVIHPTTHLTAIDWTTPPNTTAVQGEALATNLPAHIPQRMANRALNLLREAGHPAQVRPVRGRGTAEGAALLLWLPQAGFASLGEKGLPAQTVAERAVADCLAFVASGTAVDEHLADQLLLPLCLANGVSRFTTPRITQHTRTNAALLGRWLGVPISLSEHEVVVQR